MTEDDKKERARLRARQWRIDNPDRVRAYRAANRERANALRRKGGRPGPPRIFSDSERRDRARESQRRYVARNKSKVRAAAKRYAEQHQGRVKESHRRWKQRNQEKARAVQRTNRARQTDIQKARRHAKSILAEQIGIPAARIPPLLIEAKTAQLLIVKTLKRLDVKS